jgi:hypothetical protein
LKWYKHDSDASSDAKIKKLILKHGAEGYAVYFHCLELIVGDLEESNVTFELEHDSEIIADNLKIQSTSDISSIDKVNNILRTIIDLGLFQEDNDRVFCAKLAKRLDSSMTSNRKVRDIIKKTKELPLGIMRTHDAPMGNHARREEIRREEKRIDKKGNKKESKIPFSKELNNITFFNKELTTLKEKYSSITLLKIMEKLSNYKLASGKKYASDYGAINSWVAKQVEKDEGPGLKNVNTGLMYE